MHALTTLLGASAALTALLTTIATAQDPKSSDPMSPTDPNKAIQTQGTRDEGATALARVNAELRRQVATKMSDAGRSRGLTVKDDSVMFSSLDETTMVALAPTRDAFRQVTPRDASGTRTPGSEGAGGGTTGTGGTGGGTTGTGGMGTGGSGSTNPLDAGSAIGVVVISGGTDTSTTGSTGGVGGSGSTGRTGDTVPGTTRRPGDTTPGAGMTPSTMGGKLRPGTYTLFGAQGQDWVALRAEGGEQVARLAVKKHGSMSGSSGMGGGSDRPGDMGGTGRTGGSSGTGGTGGSGGTGGTGAKGEPGMGGEFGGSHPGLAGSDSWWKQVYAALLEECCAGSPGFTSRGR